MFRNPRFVILRTSYSVISWSHPVSRSLSISLSLFLVYLFSLIDYLSFFFYQLNTSVYLILASVGLAVALDCPLYASGYKPQWETTFWETPGYTEVGYFFYNAHTNNSTFTTSYYLQTLHCHQFGRFVAVVRSNSYISTINCTKLSTLIPHHKDSSHILTDNRINNQNS